MSVSISGGMTNCSSVSRGESRVWSIRLYGMCCLIVSFGRSSCCVICSNVMCFFFFFFFSSRRRHTRSYGDWSSDVCSSDLPLMKKVSLQQGHLLHQRRRRRSFSNKARRHVIPSLRFWAVLPDHLASGVLVRSEERRVGKECRSRVWRAQEKEKMRGVGVVGE